MELWHPRAKRLQLPDAGAYTGGGKKFVLHTTEGPPGSYEGAIETFKANGDPPHFLLDVVKEQRILYQFIPLNHAAKALKHTGGPETNHANAIQLEIVERAANAQHWDPWLYKYAKLLYVFAHRAFGVPYAAHHPFIGQPGYHRLSGTGWVLTEGLVGHCHCPENDHVDPGNIHIGKVLPLAT